MSASDSPKFREFRPDWTTYVTNTIAGDTKIDNEGNNRTKPI